ncbi:MAG: DUF3262 family protein [Hydrogenophaga sp.]
MSPEMGSAFTLGSGVDPDALRRTLQLLATGVIVLIFAWINLQIFQSFKSDRASTAEATWGSLKATAILCLLLGVIWR